MGAGFNVGEGGIHRINGRREFNWWFDPEAVRIAMSAPWKKITITPVDISVKTRLERRDQGRDCEVARHRWPSTTRSSPAPATCGTRSRRWRGWIRRSSRSRTKLYVNIDIDHGAELRPDDLRREGHRGRAGPAARAAQDGGVVAAARPCSGTSIRRGSTRCTSISCRGRRGRVRRRRGDGRMMPTAVPCRLPGRGLR